MARQLVLALLGRLPETEGLVVGELAAEGVESRADGDAI